MKRKAKNIIMILILLLASVGLIYSVLNIKNTIIPSDVVLRSINLTEYFVIAIFSLTISIGLLYLILSNFNKPETSFTRSKKIALFLASIMLTLLLTFITTYFITNSFKTSSNGNKHDESKLVFNGNNSITENTTISDKKYDSLLPNQNALLINGEVEVYVNNSTVTKTGDATISDNASFYGINSAVLAKDKAKVYIDNMDLTTESIGANGIFSYGNNSDGTVITVTNSKIKTTKDNSGGIMVTGGGIMDTTNLEVLTTGKQSAAIRSDRGGGLINATLGTYKTTGVGSPAVYSTANINVSSATLISEASEGIVVEGANSVNLSNVILTDTNNSLNGKSTTYKNIFLYQSTSGDATDGISSFTANSCYVTTNRGDTIYVTNTRANIELKGSVFVNNDPNGNFLRIQKDAWGKSGSNGGEVTLNLNNQNINGNIVVDQLSTLSLTAVDSSLETTINNKNEAKSIIIKLDKKSKLKLTGDSYINALNNEDTKNSNIDLNGYKLYINGVSLKDA